MRTSQSSSLILVLAEPSSQIRSAGFQLTREEQPLASNLSPAGEEEGNEGAGPTQSNPT